MSRDPTVVGRARLSAETLGEIVNGFVEPISWKTLVCTDKGRPEHHSPFGTDLLALDSGLLDYCNELGTVQLAGETPAAAAASPTATDAATA
jgi:hypothetical protein